MTKGELIRKLARRAGVSDSEAKIFFEIFLQQGAYILNPGEAVSIKGLGFFQLRKGKIRDAFGNAPEEEPNDSAARLMIYSPDEKLKDNSDETLIFNIPAKSEEYYNNIDSYFSLSIGKPVIPLRGVKNTEFFVPPSGIELRRLMESKVENLLARSETIKKYIKGSEYLIFNPDSSNAKQVEINWNEVNSGLKNDTLIKDRKSISWDFGGKIAKEIEEDSILDVDKAESDIAKEEESLSWDFGDDFVEDKNTPGIELPEVKEEPKQDQPEPKNFKRVTQLTREHKNRQETSQETSSASDEVSRSKISETSSGKDLFKNYDESFIDKEGFTEVPNKRKTYDIELSSRDQARLDSLIKEEMAKEDDSDSTDATIDFYQDEIKSDDSSRSTNKIKDDTYYSKKRSAPAFIIAILVIVLVGAALYLYLFNSDLLSPGKKSAVIKTPSVTPAVVERNYDVPVTYPYSKKGTKEDSTINAGTEVTTAGTDEKNIIETIPEPVQKSKGIKIKENLFKDGETYSVQVSSWQSKKKAEKEVLTLRNKGFIAFVEQAPIPGRGMWYRVKIGNFKTQAEAEKYLH